ncbi:hypothetical protein MSHOH_0139 [Methanosarcina horonobensis HB-1 = JCM 15518]|uniref:HTH arsR-type domain-containing protein n=1 Tax=Methanosarcina horonobensis HB-1 = JCM 15518 TaxID=1434110 RepID=A0A0E3SAC6_9EURY|nr:winged helix-turn-helix domain-containing protein [Methanosarcina horonobensis]AKB76622.1 hypothetical protein MSHOH_0139 [Methanosarcina horonobensis HB-1 = JCM 15518]
MDNDSEEQLLKILSNPIRATIIKKLYDDSLTFTHLMQLTGCKTGQLSFHLKKLDYLVEQDELKRYRLSEKGKEDVEMILPMLGNGEKEKSSSWDNFSGEEDGVQLGCAFKQFWDSLGLLIFSSLVAVKRGILYALDGLKTGTLMLAEKKNKFFSFAKTSLTGESSGIRAVERNGKAGLRSVKWKIGSLFSIIRARGTSVLKAGRKSLNPIFCYSFLILGFLLFIPAVFTLMHPAFDSTLDSAARISLNELTPEEISLANELYEKEMLPNQRNFQGNYDSLMFDAIYYEDTVGFPLSAQKIKSWKEAKAFARVQFVRDSVLSSLSLSLVLLLLGGILAYGRNSMLRRVLNSAINASILLILIAVFVLLNINAVFASEYSYPDSVFNSVPLMLKHLIGLLLLLLFSSAAGFLFLVKKERAGRTEGSPSGSNKSFPSGSEETPIVEAFDKDGRPNGKSQADLAEINPEVRWATCPEEALAASELEDEGDLYRCHEREGAVNS